MLDVRSAWSQKLPSSTCGFKPPVFQPPVFKTQKKILPSFISPRKSEKREREMTGEEVVGPAGPKLIRLLYFVGAGFICTVAINKWKDLQQKSLQLPEKPSDAVQKAIE